MRTPVGAGELAMIAGPAAPDSADPCVSFMMVKMDFDAGGSSLTVMELGDPPTEAPMMSFSAAVNWQSPPSPGRPSTLADPFASVSVVAVSRKQPLMVSAVHRMVRLGIGAPVP